MATEDAIAALRRKAGETEGDTYTDTQLQVMLSENNNDVNMVASLIWGEKASDYADLVNISEAGSSRSNSDLFKHAKEQQEYFASISDVVTADTTTSSTTRKIERV